MAGDSTMARGGGGSGFTSDGWGQYLGSYLTIPVVNRAIGGRSSRSYTREGRFASIANEVKSGDYVVIEFGINDGGGLSTDNGRSVASGTGDETQVSTYNGVRETVHTYPWYLQQAVALLKGKGATVIIASHAPRAGWTNGKFNNSPDRFVDYAKLAADRSGAQYVDHYGYIVTEYNRLGQSAVQAFYPGDYTHFTPAGAKVVAEAFVKGVIAGNKALVNRLNTAGKALGGGGSTPATTTRATTTTRAPATTTRTTGGSSGNCAALYGQWYVFSPSVKVCHG
ncbi:hypothetical protein HK097_006171 [Rhizophlyctis rosea]|uniref:SGNH hydrolase-type esterase domain-containing protein n=1 Tax=Rhizophlyctis rosea TaxID=64517 RepID=A0AAD5SJ34_9FUNG|nr:hypothetical protein HK097_006171 [Rhizophlyctis rosea]